MLMLKLERIMKIKIKLFATLKKYMNDNKDDCLLELPSSLSIRHVLDMLNVPGDIPKITLVNGIQKGFDEVL